LTLALFSCQKEVDWGTPPSAGTGGSGGSGGGTGGSGGSGGSGGGTGNLLIKDVAVTGSETMTTDYTYDAQNRLETEFMSGTSGGMSMKSYRKLFRDAAGRIVMIKQKVEQGSFPSSDTAVTIYHYPNATTNEFDYSIMNTGGLMGMVTVDSVVYTYVNGNMASNSSYMSSYMGGVLMVPASLSSKWEFTHDASGKVTKMVAYSNLTSTPGAPLDLMATYTYTYSNVNFQSFYTTNGAQNYAMAGLPTGNLTQVASMTIVSPTTPQANRTISSTYTLGANGKPQTIKQTEVTVTPPATRITNHTLTYQ
jgi:hypothetical protein